MIEVVQAGEAGKSTLLLDMHRFRTRIFRDRLGWDVVVESGDLEVDEFDTPDAVYLLALDAAGSVVGTWRMLPSDGPTMVRDVWPEFLTELPLPRTRDVWEMSRFAVAPQSRDPRQFVTESKEIVGAMFCALTELCLRAGIREVFTFYDQRIERIVRQLDCVPYAATAARPIEDFTARVGLFRTNREMLRCLRNATGRVEDVLPPHFVLPPSLYSIGAKHDRPVTA